MSLIRINRNPSGRQLAVFALAWLVFAAAAGAVLWHHGHLAAAASVWELAAAVPIIGVISRRLLRLIYLGLCYAAYPVGFVVSHVAVALVYYLALTPIGLTMRLLRYDPLKRAFDRSAQTYWVRRGEKKPVENYFRQS
jgi:hypothetical protein